VKHTTTCNPVRISSGLSFSIIRRYTHRPFGAN
jgi:hypothetical protein